MCVFIKIGLLVINVAMALNDVIDTGTVRVKPYLEYKMQIKIKHVDIDYSEVHECLYLIQMYVHLHMYTEAHMMSYDAMADQSTRLMR